MSRKWFDNKVPNIDGLPDENEISSLAKETINNYLKHFDSYKLDLAAKEILNLAINTNLYLNDKQPWTLIKEDPKYSEVKDIIYNVLESTRIIGTLLLPILPDLSSKIDLQLGSIYSKEIPWKEQLEWGILNNSSLLPKPNPIIDKLEYG